MRRARRFPWSRIAIGWALAFSFGSSFAASYRPAGDARGAGDELFTNAFVRHLQIQIPEEGMQTLRKYSFRSRKEILRTNVPATIREGQLVWTNVAVHLKGAYGSFRPVDGKPSLTLNFDKWAKGQRFHGLEKISLNNSLQDPSYLSERICRRIYNAAGVPVPRTDFATVDLNGRRLGLFVLAEGWNNQFLRRHFDNAKGNFYDLGNSHDVNKPLPASFGRSPRNHAILEAVTEAAAEPDHVRRMALLSATVDLDRFLALTALDVLMWNWDGYAINRNNYRMFHELESDRLVFFPHGLDQMFWKPNGPIVTGRRGLVSNALLETSQGRRLYLARFGQLRAEVFDVRAITNEISQLTARLQPALAAIGPGALAQQRSGAAILRNRIVARARDIDQQLAGIKGMPSLRLNEAAAITNWLPREQFGGMILDRTADSPAALHLAVRQGSSFAAWNATVWLEEGRYRLEGRIKTRGVSGGVSREAVGAGFRVWSDRKETRGASWGWFPYSSSRDPRLGGIIPVMNGTVETRLTGDQQWTTVTHEFELRQPVADLQIQCALQAAAGEAWFDVSSLTIRRLSVNVSKGGGNARGE